jgi:hypothetical protein
MPARSPFWRKPHNILICSRLSTSDLLERYLSSLPITGGSAVPARSTLQYSGCNGREANLTSLE